MNIQELHYKSKSYPQLLQDISSPPKILYCVGSIPELPMIAVVGSRKPTDYGKQVTYKLAYDLAKAGFCIVSGLAYGIDAIAHQAAVEANGRAVAILGSAIDQVYPVANRNLAKTVLAKNGAIISEYAAGTNTQKFNFPARNRIIAGLSLGVVITEADAKSGSLITANFALQNNRQIFAVPGNITSQRSAGPNNLIKLGAKAVTDAADILAEFSLQSPELQAKPIRADSPEEAHILELMGQGTNNTQALIEKTALPAAELASILSLMEITGKIRNMGAGQWIAC